MKPEVWGKHYWFVIHVAALKYPQNPTESDVEIYRTFYNNMWHFIPCAKCSSNYKNHLIELPVENHMKNNATLFQWTVDLHNIVNKSLKKPVISYKDALELYSNVTDDSFQPSKNEKNAMKTLIGLNIAILIIIVVYIIVISIKLSKRKF